MNAMKHQGFYILRFILIIFLTLILAGAVFSEDNRKIFPLSKIKPGLSGYACTVFQGIKIEKFKVKVLALTYNEKQAGPLILVRLSGGALQKNGGLSSGMSGSPVYIGGKLAGAISYGFENADPFLAMVTPIEEMLKLMNTQGSFVSMDAAQMGSAHLSDAQIGSAHLSDAQIGSAHLSDAQMGPAHLSDAQMGDLAGPDILPLGTPVMVSGMGQRGYELVRRSLAGYGLQTMAAPVLSYPGVNLRNVVLEPGSSIGVQMIEGDYQIAAIGTVTMIDPQSGNFLAFGHPFTNRGTVDFLAVACYILQTVKSPAMSFKMGAPLKPVGRISQDRQTGVLGHQGEPPNLIGVTVKVHDQERRLERQSSFQVITDEQLYPDLIVAGVTDAVDQTLNRVGAGTATVSLRITPEESPLLSRENLFFGKDIAADCLEDLQKALDLLAGNEYAAVPIRTVELDIKVQPEQITARILKLSGPQVKVKRGETVTISVTAHSYRGTDFTVPFEVKLPADLEPGKLTFTVRGGFQGGTGAGDAGQSKRSSPTPDSYSQDKNSLKSLLADYLNAPKNNEFVLEYQPLTGSRPSEDSGPKGNESAKPKPIQLRAGGGYFILGEAQLTLEVIQE